MTISDWTGNPRRAGISKPGRPSPATRGKRVHIIYREFHARFLTVAGELGFDPKSAESQWWAVAKVAAGTS